MRQTLLISIFSLICYTGISQTALNVDSLFNWNDEYISNRKGVKFNDIWGYVDCEGREYAIFGSQKYIHVFDVTEPASSREISRMRGGSISVWRDFKTYKNFTYAVADEGDEGLLIINMANLPTETNIVYQDNQTFQKAHNIFIDSLNARLYVAGSNTVYEGLIIYDISIPDQPQIIGQPYLEGGKYVHDIFVKDNIAYCSHGWEGFYIWDCNNPSAPTMLAYLETIGYNHSSWMSADGQYIFYTEEIPEGVPVGVIDISNMENGEIELVHEFKMPLIQDSLNVTPHNPFVVDNYLVLSYYEDGVQIFDVSDPEQPERVAYYDTAPNNTFYNGTRNNWGVYPFFPSKNIIATDTKNGFFILKPTFDEWDENENDLVSPNCTFIGSSLNQVGNIYGLQDISLSQNGDILTIHFLKNKFGLQYYKIYNALGQVMNEQQLEGYGVYDLEISIHTIATGIYWLNIRDEEGGDYTFPFYKY